MPWRYACYYYHTITTLQITRGRACGPTAPLSTCGYLLPTTHFKVGLFALLLTIYHLLRASHPPTLAAPHPSVGFPDCMRRSFSSEKTPVAVGEAHEVPATPQPKGVTQKLDAWAEMSG